MVLRETLAAWAMSTIVAFCSPRLPKKAYPALMMRSRVSAAVAWVMWSARGENQPAGRHPGARGDEHMLDVVDLVVRRAANLAHPFGDAVHAVDVCLAEQSAVGVDRQLAAQ